LDQNQFRRVVQKTHLAPIQYFINKNKEENKENETLIKKFVDRLLQCISINDLNSNFFTETYYKLIKKHNPEAFEKVDIQRIFEKTSHVKKCPTSILIEKMLADKDWLHKCIKM